MSLICCKNVSFAYEGNTVIENINFEVNRGNYVCILGENGAGKSTMVKGLLQLKKPSQGTIQLGDGLKENQIGYLPQQTAIQRDFPASVFEVVLSGRQNHLGKKLFYSREDKETARVQMERLGLQDMQKRCYRELSGGQQQRVLLARALCASSELLVLDEPVTGLDPLMANEFYQLISELNKNEKHTIIMVTHDIKGSVEYASHVLHIGLGFTYYGTKEDYVQTDFGKQFLGSKSQETCLEGGNENAE